MNTHHGFYAGSIGAKDWAINQKIKAMHPETTRINLKKMDVKVNNKTTKINPQEKKILEKMLEYPGKVFSRNSIGKIKIKTCSFFTSK